MPPIFAVTILASCLLDPVLWTLALCGVLLGRKLQWSGCGTVLAGAALATLGSLLILSILSPVWEVGFIGFGARVVASLIAAGVVLWILQTFVKRKAK